jgi:SAM-dependent methyltransferase
VADLMLDPSPEVTAEAEGLKRFALEMQRDGWDRARILRLPHEEHGYWWAQWRGMKRLLETVPFTPGQRILDIGANTCWASAAFARAGLWTVALDISMTEMQGLRTADWWFEDQGIYFERVLAQMGSLPFADSSFDWVFCCEVLHHNSRREMARALREIHRVLRPGGSLLVMNEPLRWPTDLKRDHAAEVAQFAGNEHVYSSWSTCGLRGVQAFTVCRSRRPRLTPSCQEIRSNSPFRRASWARSSSPPLTPLASRRSPAGRVCGGDISLAPRRHCR